jgi:hypothetical protein
MDEMKETVETLIDLDEPEALLTTLKRAAARQKGERWKRLADALAVAEASLADQQEPTIGDNTMPPVADEAKAE